MPNNFYTPQTIRLIFESSVTMYRLTLQQKPVQITLGTPTCLRLCRASIHCNQVEQKCSSGNNRIDSKPTMARLPIPGMPGHSYLIIYAMLLFRLFYIPYLPLDDLNINRGVICLIINIYQVDTPFLFSKQDSICYNSCATGFTSSL